MFLYVFDKDKTVIYFRDCADRYVIEMRAKENPGDEAGFSKEKWEDFVILISNCGGVCEAPCEEYLNINKSFSKRTLG